MLRTQSCMPSYGIFLPQLGQYFKKPEKHQQLNKVLCLMANLYFNSVNCAMVAKLKLTLKYQKNKRFSTAFLQQTYLA